MKMVNKFIRKFTICKDATLALHIPKDVNKFWNHGIMHELSCELRFKPETNTLSVVPIDEEYWKKYDGQDLDGE
jgi:hypothetical protein